MEINDIILFGLSHKSAPLEVREKAALGEAACLQGMGHLAVESAISEILIYSTCNRVEILYVAGDKAAAALQIKDFLKARTKLNDDDFAAYFYTKTGLAAVKHLFSVAAGLDSMVVGEPQILGQVKKAYAGAVQARSTGVMLNGLLHKTFAVAKRVRTETAVGSRAVSISHAAVDLAENLCGDLSGVSVLIIGAGEMGGIAARKMARRQPKELVIVNRTHAKAQALAEDLNAKALPWEELLEALERADLVISSVVRDNYVLNRNDLQNRAKPLTLIDIGLPRALEPQIADLTNCRLYDLDALQAIIKQNMALRAAEAQKAEALINDEVLVFDRWLRASGLKPTLLALRAKLHDIVALELAKTKTAEISPDEIHRLAKAVVNRFLHQPAKRLKNAEHDAAKELYLDTLRKLFDLDA